MGLRRRRESKWLTDKIIESRPLQQDSIDHSWITIGKKETQHGGLQNQKQSQLSLQSSQQLQVV